jgi:hypothetical protein
MLITSILILSTIPAFLILVRQPAFISYLVLDILAVLILIFYFAPRYGERLPIVYISICSLIGSLVVIATQGLGASLVTSASTPGNNQLLLWETWLVVAFVILGGITQVNYLNKGIALLLDILSTQSILDCDCFTCLLCVIHNPYVNRCWDPWGSTGILSKHVSLIYTQYNVSENAVDFTTRKLSKH